MARHPATTAAPSTNTFYIPLFAACHTERLTSRERTGAKHLAAKTGYTSIAGIFMCVIPPLLGAATTDRALGVVYGAFSGFAVDARGARFGELSRFMDSSHLDGVESWVDIKDLGIGESSDCAFFCGEEDSSSPLIAGP